MATPETFPFTYYLTPLGWLHLVLFGVAVPLLVIKNRKKMTGAGGPLPDRMRHFRTAVLEGSMLASLSLGVATLQHIDLVPRAWPSGRAIGFGVAAYMAAVGFMRSIVARRPGVCKSRSNSGPEIGFVVGIIRKANPQRCCRHLQTRVTAEGV